VGRQLAWIIVLFNRCGRKAIAPVRRNPVLTGASNTTVSAMKEVVVQFVQDALIAGRQSAAAAVVH
jgi:hypothetical protein